MRAASAVQPPKRMFFPTNIIKEEITKTIHR
jgi:hypothetical protein